MQLFGKYGHGINYSLKLIKIFPTFPPTCEHPFFLACTFASVIKHGDYISIYFLGSVRYGYRTYPVGLLPHCRAATVQQRDQTIL